MLPFRFQLWAAMTAGPLVTGILMLSLFAVPPAVRAQQASTARYFPIATFDRFRNEWYSRCLALMAEPRLFGTQGGGTEVYRLLWLRSFHEPVAVRLQVDADREAVLTVKILSGNGHCSPSNRVRQWLSATLPRQRVAEFLTALAQADYWTLTLADPTCDRTGPVRVACVDGAQWVLEAVRSDTYHVVDRWSNGIPYRKRSPTLAGGGRGQNRAGLLRRPHEPSASRSRIAPRHAPRATAR
jgi:hypothetical protein